MSYKVGPDDQYNRPNSLPDTRSVSSKPSRWAQVGCIAALAVVGVWLAVSWIAIAAYLIRYWP